jgi:hypothetical protein
VCEEGDSIVDLTSYWQLAAHEVPADEVSAVASAAKDEQQQGEVEPPVHLVRMRHVLPPDGKGDKSPLVCLMFTGRCDHAMH